MAALLSFGSVACAKDDKTPVDDGQSSNNSVPTLIVSNSVVNINVGDVFEVKYSLKNSDKTVCFESKDQNVATVGSDGKITGVSVGQTIVIVSAGDTIKNIEVNVEASPTYSIICDDGETISLLIGDTFTINPVLLKGNVQIDCDFTFTSLNPSLVTVNQGGQVSITSRGKGIVQVSTEKDGKTYSMQIEILGHELCYIEADDVIVKQGVEATVVYQVKEYPSGTVITDAVAEIVADKNVAVNGNKIVANSIGKFAVKIFYYGVEKIIYVESLYNVELTEFNYFKEPVAIEDSCAYRKSKFGEANYKATLSLVGQVNGQTLDKGNYLKIDAKNSNGACIEYLGVYLKCLQTKAGLEDLLDLGYTKIKVEYLIESESTKTNSFVFRWINEGLSSTYKANTAKTFGTWQSYELSLEKYITYYDNLNTFNTSNAHYYTMLETSIDNETIPYVIYLKPINIIK